MKRVLFLLFICCNLILNAQSHYITGVVRNGEKSVEQLVLYQNDIAYFIITDSQGNYYYSSLEDWEFKVENKEDIALTKGRYTNIPLFLDRQREISIDINSAIYTNKLCSDFKRYTFDNDRSTYYKAIVNYEGTLKGEKVSAEFPVLLNLLPSIPEIKIVDIFWGTYDEQYRLYDDAYMILEIDAERLERVLGQEVYANTNGKGYIFYLDIDPETNRAKVDFLFDDSHFIFRGGNSNGSVVSKDTIYIKELEQQAAGVENLIKNKLQFYPNPVKDVLYIQNKCDYASSIAIYSLNGTLLKYFNSGNEAIDLSDLVKGIYLLEYKTHNRDKKEFIKLIKE